MDEADEVDALIDRARDAMEDISSLARALLERGADLKRVHRKYIAIAFDLIEEAEAQALLATVGDRPAHGAIEQIVAQLARLQRQARDELNRYAREGED